MIPKSLHCARTPTVLQFDHLCSVLILPHLTQVYVCDLRFETDFMAAMYTLLKSEEDWGVTVSYSNYQGL